LKVPEFSFQARCALKNIRKTNKSVHWIPDFENVLCGWSSPRGDHNPKNDSQQWCGLKVSTALRDLPNHRIPKRGGAPSVHATHAGHALPPQVWDTAPWRDFVP